MAKAVELYESAAITGPIGVRNHLAMIYLRPEYRSDLRAYVWISLSEDANQYEALKKNLASQMVPQHALLAKAFINSVNEFDKKFKTLNDEINLNCDLNNKLKK